MPLPEAGQTLPDFSLPAYNSSATIRLSEQVGAGAALLVFFKQSCATSKMTVPFVERLHSHYPALAVLGVSQDDPADTASFVAQTGVSFPVVLDSGWHVSAAYDLFTVPTLFLLDSGGMVRRVNMGWNTEHFTALSAQIAELLGTAPVPLLREGDKVPPFKPG